MFFVSSVFGFIVTHFRDFWKCNALHAKQDQTEGEGEWGRTRRAANDFMRSYTVLPFGDRMLEFGGNGLAVCPRMCSKR